MSYPDNLRASASRG